MFIKSNKSSLFLERKKNIHNWIALNNHNQTDGKDSSSLKKLTQHHHHQKEQKAENSPRKPSKSRKFTPSISPFSICFNIKIPSNSVRACHGRI